jgi:hypothetical protein
LIRNADDCLAKIAAVRAAARDPEAAYLIRTRLRRAVLASHRAVAAQCGVRPPQYPGYLELPKADSQAREVLRSANRVLAISERLCQPSEALDIRWRTGWSQLDSALVDLESALTEWQVPRTAKA